MLFKIFLVFIAGILINYFIIKNYKNLNFNDRGILNLLFTKSMLFEKRLRFMKAIGKSYISEELLSKNINSAVKDVGDYVVYQKILLKILYPQT